MHLRVGKHVPVVHCLILAVGDNCSKIEFNQYFRLLQNVILFNIPHTP
jgi:hypothetical protein